MTLLNYNVQNIIGYFNYHDYLAPITVHYFRVKQLCYSNISSSGPGLIFVQIVYSLVLSIDLSERFALKQKKIISRYFFPNDYVICHFQISIQEVQIISGQDLVTFANSQNFSVFMVNLVFSNLLWQKIITVFHCYKWPNIEQITQPSGYTASYLVVQSNYFSLIHRPPV